MGKWVTFSIRDKKLAKDPEIRKWLKGAEKLIDEEMERKRPEFVAAAIGLLLEEMGESNQV